MKIKLDEYNFIITVTTDDNCLCGCPDNCCCCIRIDGDTSIQLFYGGGVPIYKYINEQMTMVTDDKDYVGTSWESIFYKSMDDFYIANGRLPYYGTSLDMVKKYKIQELFNACQTNIYNGFPSKAFDGVTEKKYDFAEQDQSDITSIASMIGMDASFTIYWKAQGELISYIWTITQFKTLCNDAYTSKLLKMLSYHILRYQVLNCTTRVDVEAITYTNI